MMEFDINTVEFDILDVLHVVRRVDTTKPCLAQSPGWPFAALSCRLSGYSEILADGRIFRPDVDNYILSPAGKKYVHHHFNEELIIVHLNFTRNPPPDIQLFFCMDPSIKERFWTLHKNWMEKKPGYLCKCKSILYDVFSLFQQVKFISISTKITESMKYLYSNYRSPGFSIREMIACSYVSESYFRRTFRQLYKCSIVEFVNRLRVDYAKSLIESRSYSISEVAELSGFRDDKYFSQVFKKFTGSTPSGY